MSLKILVGSPQSPVQERLDFWESTRVGPATFRSFRNSTETLYISLSFTVLFLKTMFRYALQPTPLPVGDGQACGDPDGSYWARPSIYAM